MSCCTCSLCFRSKSQPILCCPVLCCLVPYCCRDVGVYVAITSLEPLLAYVHTGGVLLRFCSAEYVRDIKPSTPTNTYVIYGLDDYTPATESEGHVDAVPGTLLYCWRQHQCWNQQCAVAAHANPDMSTCAQQPCSTNLLIWYIHAMDSEPLSAVMCVAVQWKRCCLTLLMLATIQTTAPP